MTTPTKRDAGFASYTGDAPAATGQTSEPSDSAAFGLGGVAPRTLLIVAVAVAALVRIAWTMKHGFVMEQEGVEYARIAENLRAGRGYMGIFANGTQLNFPPLYPVMIAVVSILTGNSEIAARIINIGLGALLVIPMYKIAHRLYGPRVAGLVAVLAVFHPVLIAGASSTYSEGPYLTLFFSGIMWLLTWAVDRRVSATIWAGVFLGLAYLIRPEAFVIAGGFTALGILASFFVRDRRAMLIGAFALAATFLVIASPNIIFLTRATGKLRIEAKGTLAYYWGQRMLAGMPYNMAATAIGDDLSDQGVFMRPNIEIINSTPPSRGQYVAFLLKAARRNLPVIRDIMINSTALGSPYLFVLVILGIFAAPWNQRRTLLDGMFLAALAMNIVVLLTVQALWFRYFYSLLAFLLIWGAKGADELFEWGRKTVLPLTGGSPLATRSGLALKWGAVAVVLAASLRELPQISQYSESLYKIHADAGRWLATQAPAHKWVMDTGLQVPYYAGADLAYLPYTSSDIALKYIAKRKPDYIVLHTDRINVEPYTAQWFAEGIPDKRAVLVFNRGTPLDSVKIYRWVDVSQ